MSVNLYCKNFPLKRGEINELWSAVLQYTNRQDQTVNISCVPLEEIKQLNHKYRQQNEATNVLTFSYDLEHDVALCLPVIIQESSASAYSLRGYTAQVVVHAFLHAMKFDHAGLAEKKRMIAAEKTILAQGGFAPVEW